MQPQTHTHIHAQMNAYTCYHTLFCKPLDVGYNEYLDLHVTRLFATPTVATSGRQEPIRITTNGISTLRQQDYPKPRLFEVRDFVRALHRRISLTATLRGSRALRWNMLGIRSFIVIAIFMTVGTTITFEHVLS